MENSGGWKTYRKCGEKPLPQNVFGPPHLRYVFPPLFGDSLSFPLKERGTDQTNPYFWGLQKWFWRAHPAVPKGPSRTVFTTESDSVVFHYSVVNLLRIVIHYSKYNKSVWNIVIHYIFSTESLRVVNSLQIVNSLRILFLVRKGPLGTFPPPPNSCDTFCPPPSAAAQCSVAGWNASGAFLQTPTPILDQIPEPIYARFKKQKTS